MGKGRRNRNRKPHFLENKKKENQKENGDRKPYEYIVRENESFVTYYKKQNICTDDWDEFLSKMKTDLPSSFRITATRNEANALLSVVENQYIDVCKQQSEENARNFFPLPWYPNRLAWQLGLTRKDIRRNEAYYRLHNLLVSETENGTMSRQETVSMIPPLVLNVKSHHKILDMCAAPGSKTAQLIELLHGSGSGSDEKTVPSGFIIANDIDNNRCYMLVHQAKRLNSPCVAITNHNSQFMPNFITSETTSETLQFDRILCDVPCSGDGTLRKNPDIWLKWTCANGLNQHFVQYQIAKRGAELLTVGGRLVYSTCSLNPIENEAVIHRLLQYTNGALRLVDVSEELQGLKFSPGLEDWFVGSKQLEFYETFEEVSEKWKTVIHPSMFPPKKEDRQKYQLTKCVRILPHYQDTGAFFVAVLEKTTPIQNSKNDNIKKQSDSETNPEEQTESKPPPSKRAKLTNRQKLSGYKEDPFVFFEENEDVWTSIKEFYNISDEFDPKCLLTRCLVGKKKNIYYCTPELRSLVMLNQNRIKFINTGLKTFVRSDNRHMKCAFRLAHEGIESTFEHIKGRKVNIPKKDLIMLLENTDPLKSPQITTLSAEVQEQVKDLSPGSCILCYNSTEEDALTLTISGWRGTSSLRCYVTDYNAAHYLRLLGGDTSKYDVNKFQKGSEGTEEAEGTTNS